MKKSIFIIIVLFLILIIIILLSKLFLTNNKKVERNDDMRLEILIGDNVLTAKLYNNSSVSALIEKLKKQDITIYMNDYMNMEKVGELGFDIPENNININTSPGDLILYQGNKFVIYYENNSYSLTRIGRIENMEKLDLKRILGSGDIIITLRLKS